MKCVFQNRTRERKWREFIPLLEKCAKAAEVTCEIPENAVLAVIFVKAKRIHEINRMYRNIDRATDVITFAAQEGEVFDQEEMELGDIFINVEAVEAQALEYGHSEEREFAFLFIHGLLHTLGYDHMTTEEEKEMFALQDEILDPILPR